jgi:hypothetical protein
VWYKTLTNSFTSLLLLAIYFFHSPQALSISFAYQAGLVPVKGAVYDKAEKFIDWIRAWSWRVFWTQPSLLLFMTFMHNDVWLPFLLSMTSVLIIVIMAYIPEDTGQCRPSYIPKRHRKWSRYRSRVTRCIASCFGSTSTARWIVKQSCKIDIAISTSKTTRRHRGQKRGQDSLSVHVNKGVRKCISFATDTAAYKATQKGIDASGKAMRNARRAMVTAHQDSPSMVDIIDRSIVPLLLSRASAKLQLTCIVTCLAICFACALHTNGKEIQGKMQQIKKIINDTTAFRATLSGSTWMDIAVAMSTSIKVVDHNGIISTATIVCLVASNLLILQNYLIEYHDGEQEKIDEEEGFINCNQSIDEQQAVEE